MKRLVVFCIVFCVFLSGCAKSELKTVWKVQSYEATESKLPVAPSIAFCKSTKENRHSEMAPQKRTFAINGEKYDLEYHETEYTPDMTGSELLKHRRAHDIYIKENGDKVLFYESSEIIKDYSCAPGKQEAIYTKEELETMARNMLLEFYPDAKDYELTDSWKGGGIPMENYVFIFRKKIAGLFTSESVSFNLQTSGALKVMISEDYQVYKDVEITEKQLESAKKKLINSMGKNDSYDEDSYEIKMGDDGKLYLSVEVNCIKKSNGPYGYLYKESRFTLL